LEKDFYLGALGSFECDFTQGSKQKRKSKEDAKPQKNHQRKYQTTCIHGSKNSHPSHSIEGIQFNVGTIKEGTTTTYETRA
jgi:hypothetical protein